MVKETKHRGPVTAKIIVVDVDIPPVPQKQITRHKVARVNSSMAIAESKAIEARYRT